MADDPEGFDDAVTDAEGDPRVILALNLLLSSAFAWLVVWGLSALDVAAYTAVNVATLAVVLVGVTYLITRY
jgi:high-affinity Fe2+/Pb2+ permease